MSFYYTAAVPKLTDPKLKCRARMVLVVIADYADEFGISYPSIGTIAKESGQSRRSVQNQVIILQFLGLMDVETRTRPGLRNESNRYWLKFKPVAARKKDSENGNGTGNKNGHAWVHSVRGVGA